MKLWIQKTLYLYRYGRFKRTIGHPFTDFGFKRLFGREANKELLIDLLNQILKDEQEPIVELTYHKNQRLGQIAPDRKAIFDIYCENEKGEKFVVEMQKNEQRFFKDRSIYYATFPIDDQAEKSLWDYKLKAIYMRCQSSGRK